MALDYLQNHLEALIFAAQEPVTPAELQQALSQMFNADVPDDHIAEALAALVTKYEDDRYVFSVVHLAGGYQFLTKPAYQAGIAILLRQKSRKKLSTSALETLAIIAYRQPITKTEIEQIRGVSSDYALQKLLERELIVLKGKADAPGRPLLYGTGHKFLEFFGINSLTDLPQLKDFKNEDGDPGLLDSDGPGTPDPGPAPDLGPAPDDQTA